MAVPYTIAAVHVLQAAWYNHRSVQARERFHTTQRSCSSVHVGTGGVSTPAIE
jgi:hypothetical protein